MNLSKVDSTSGPQESYQRIADDDVDLAIGVFPHLPKELFKRELYRDTLICVADKSNKRLRNGRLDLKAHWACLRFSFGFRLGFRGSVRERSPAVGFTGTPYLLQQLPDGLTI